MMGSPFDDLDAQLAAEILTAYGETVSIFPRRSGTYATPGSDYDRQPVSALVVLSDSPGLEWLSGARRGSDLVGGTRVNVGETELWMSKAQADELGFKLSKGDRVEFSSRGTAYNVVSVMTTDMGDVRALLVREGEG
jgi:hypothetical protein